MAQSKRYLLCAGALLVLRAIKNVYSGGIVVRLRSHAINWRTLAYSFIVSVVLFIIAAPLGDDKHGIGKNHPLVADIGNFVRYLLD